ncbi:MAG TPA: sirohydrochlorin chelatase [Oscillatoriaceae cyanobacterium M7585_C2015_266]|nr:sirohydrochlorin chelatase [Oscillatoriaceae cyanobacterium M7585_C2015_266]
MNPFDLSSLAKPAEPSLKLPALSVNRPLLLIGHGSQDEEGRQGLLDFAAAYQALDTSRPVVPCFLELTQPSIQEGVARCVEEGYTEISALPLLLFAARHNKFDVTNELDRARERYPNIKFYYGRHLGIAPGILELWRARLAKLDKEAYKREETVLLFVGRGSSDPDANGDTYKMARMLWEGSGYLTVETCFIGITHPRLQEGFRRARFYQPKRIIVLPHLLFTGVLVKRIFQISQEQQEQYPDISITCLPEIGIEPQLLLLLREREIETQLGQVQMNCEMCKFRLAALVGEGKAPSHEYHYHSHEHAYEHPHRHGNGHHHFHFHAHEHSDAAADPYVDLEKYHQRIWQVP